MKKRVIILATFLLLSTISVFAQCYNIKWTVKDSTLIISGEGAIPDYVISHWGMPPWFWGIYYEDYYIKEVVIGDSITRIGNNSFYSLYSIAVVTIPNSVTSIGEDAFHGCSIVSISIPNSVTSIESCAFIGCSFDSITIPNKVKSIRRSTFVYCRALTSVTLPSGVTSIEDCAFYGCTALTSFTNLNPIPVEINRNVFHQVDISACTLYVPINSVSAYQNAEVWKEFKIEGIEVGIDEIKVPAIKVYPNPTTDKVYIEKESAIKVYNLQGALLQETFGKQVDLSAYPQGVYLLQVEGKVIKVVKY